MKLELINGKSADGCRRDLRMVGGHLKRGRKVGIRRGEIGSTLRKLMTSDSNGEKRRPCWSWNDEWRDRRPFYGSTVEILHTTLAGYRPKYHPSGHPYLTRARISLDRFLVTCFAYVSSLTSLLK